MLEPIPGKRILRLVRNATPFKKVNELVGALDELEGQLRLVDRTEYALFVDTRAIVGRTDPGFEKTFRHWRLRAVRGFQRVAVLVATREGMEQARRHAREQGERVEAFDDENAAMAWLEDGLQS